MNKSFLKHHTSRVPVVPTCWKIVFKFISVTLSHALCTDTLLSETYYYIWQSAALKLQVVSGAERVSASVVFIIAHVPPEDKTRAETFHAFTFHAFAAEMFISLSFAFLVGFCPFIKNRLFGLPLGSEYGTGVRARRQRIPLFPRTWYHSFISLRKSCTTGLYACSPVSSPRQI